MGNYQPPLIDNQDHYLNWNIGKLQNSELFYFTFSIAMRILVDSRSDFRATHMQYCRDLIMYFVDNSEEFYGERFQVYNVHLPDDIQLFNKSLDEILAFPYENHQKTIKKYVKKFPETNIPSCEKGKMNVTNNRAHFSQISTVTRSVFSSSRWELLVRERN